MRGVRSLYYDFGDGLSVLCGLRLVVNNFIPYIALSENEQVLFTSSSWKALCNSFRSAIACLRGESQVLYLSIEGYEVLLCNGMSLLVIKCKNTYNRVRISVNQLNKLQDFSILLDQHLSTLCKCITRCETFLQEVLQYCVEMMRKEISHFLQHACGDVVTIPKDTVLRYLKSYTSRPLYNEIILVYEDHLVNLIDQQLLATQLS